MDGLTDKQIKARARVLARSIDLDGNVRNSAPSWVWEIAAGYDGRASGSFVEGRATLPWLRMIAMDIAAGGGAEPFADVAAELCNSDRLMQWVLNVRMAREFCDMHTGTLSETLRLGHRDWLANLYRDTVANLIVMGD